MFAGQVLKFLGANGDAASGFVPQLQMLTGVMLVLGASVLLLHEYISRSATFRSDTLDVPPRKRASAGADAQRGRDRRGASVNDTNGSAARRGEAEPQSSAPVKAVQDASSPPGAAAASPSRRASGDRWSSENGAAYVMHARQGPGIVLQVMDGRSLCVRAEDDEPCNIDDCGAAAEASDAVTPTAGKRGRARHSQAGAVGSSKWTEAATRGRALATRGTYPMGRKARGAKSAAGHDRTQNGASDGSSPDADPASKKDAKRSASFVDAVKCDTASCACALTR